MSAVVEIPLGRSGLVARVHASDEPLVSGFKWYAMRRPHTVYVQSPQPGGSTLLLHRVVMGLDRGDRRQVDHVNGDGLDNTRGNLRVCTNGLNCAAARIARTRNGCPVSSSFRGVSRTHARWKAACGDQGYLGTFATEIEAALAYDRAARERYGEFARLNFPEGQP